MSIDESIGLLNGAIKILKRHIHLRRVQLYFYNNVKNEIIKIEVLIDVDYSDSCKNKQQQEIQSAYFGHTTFSDAENKMIYEFVTITSKLSEHSGAAAITSTVTIMSYLREKHQHLPLKSNPIVWIDGCFTQLRSRFAFKLLSSIDSYLNITWCCNESHHGKTSRDGIGEASKICVYHDVMSGKCVLATRKQFAEHAYKAVKYITSLNLPAEDVLLEPDDIEASPRIKDALQIYMIKQFFDEENVPYLQFFKMDIDEKPFFTQFYGKGACGHQKIAVDDNHSG